MSGHAVEARVRPERLHLLLVGPGDASCGAAANSDAQLRGVWSDAANSVPRSELNFEASIAGLVLWELVCYRVATRVWRGRNELDTDGLMGCDSFLSGCLYALLSVESTTVPAHGAPALPLAVRAGDADALPGGRGLLPALPEVAVVQVPLTLGARHREGHGRRPVAQQPELCALGRR